jgi:hypothetical protein
MIDFTFCLCNHKPNLITQFDTLCTNKHCMQIQGNAANKILFENTMLMVCVYAFLLGTMCLYV